MHKYANLVELETCCQTHIFLQNLVLIQPRTSPPKICKKFANYIKYFPILLTLNPPRSPRDLLARAAAAHGRAGRRLVRRDLRKLSGRRLTRHTGGHFFVDSNPIAIENACFLAFLQLFHPRLHSGCVFYTTMLQRSGKTGKAWKI